MRLELLSNSEAWLQPVALSTVAMTQEDGEELRSHFHVDPQSREDTVDHVLVREGEGGRKREGEGGRKREGEGESGTCVEKGPPTTVISSYSS